MRLYLTATLAALACLSSADAGQDHWTPLTLQNLAFYTKPKDDQPGFWQQEIGLLSPITGFGRFRATGNVAYVLKYPLKSTIEARYTAGMTFTYRLWPQPTSLALHLKTKSNFVGKWEQEFGLAALLYQKGQFSVSTSAAYLRRYPIDFTTKPTWTASLTLAYRLR